MRISSEPIARTHTVRHRRNLGRTPRIEWNSNSVFSSKELTIDPRVIGFENSSTRTESNSRTDDTTSHSKHHSKTAVVAPNKGKKLQQQPTLPGTETVRLGRPLAHAFRMLARFFYPGPEIWVVLDYLMMYPSIRDFDLAEKCGLDVKSVRKACAHLIRDHIITSKIRAIKVPITEEEAKNRKKPMPSNGMKQQRHTFYQLYPHIAANATRLKLLRMRRSLDEASVDPDEIGLPEGIELWYKCSYCGNKVTNLHADMVYAAGAFDNTEATVLCPQCDTPLTRTLEGNESVIGSRKVMSVFNRKLKRVLDRFFKQPSIVYPPSAANQKFLEGDDLSECLLFQKSDTPSPNESVIPPEKTDRSEDLTVIFDESFGFERRRKRALPIWLMEEKEKIDAMRKLNINWNSLNQEIVYEIIIDSTFYDILDILKSDSTDQNPESTTPPARQIPEFKRSDGTWVAVTDVDELMYYSLSPRSRGQYEGKAIEYRLMQSGNLIVKPKRSVHKRSYPLDEETRQKIPRIDSETKE